MKKYLNKTYPFYYDVKTSFLIASLVFILSTLFSFFFEPFEVNFSELKFSFLLISVIHSLVSFLIFMISAIVLSRVRSFDSDWKLKNEFSFLLIVLILIGVVQFLIRDFIYLKEDNWSLKYLFEEIRNTLLVGSLLIFIITSLNIERLKKIYIKKSKDLGTSLKFHDTNTKEKVLIKTQVLSDDFILDVDDFLYAKSDKNYVELFMKDGAVLLKRMTIKSFEEQVSSYNNVCRVHRSYIINLKSIKKIEGNSQGLQLWINDIDFIPVSRNMISTFEKALKVISN